MYQNTSVCLGSQFNNRSVLIEAILKEKAKKMGTQGLEPQQDVRRQKILELKRNVLRSTRSCDHQEFEGYSDQLNQQTTIYSQLWSRETQKDKETYKLAAQLRKNDSQGINMTNHKVRHASQLSHYSEISKEQSRHSTKRREREIKAPASS